MWSELLSTPVSLPGDGSLGCPLVRASPSRAEKISRYWKSALLEGSVADPSRMSLSVELLRKIRPFLPEKYGWQFSGGAFMMRSE